MLIWFGLRNSVDPLWIEAGALLRRDTPMLDDRIDSLQRLYHELHGWPPPLPTDSSAFRLVSAGTLPVLQWQKFRDFSRTVRARRFVVLSGVTGAGATNLASRAGRLLAGKPENLLEINCAPQFDVEYHKKYIGQETDGRFEPGILLQFMENCRRTPHENFVALIDNFDKINPETFFGPDLWETLSNLHDTARLGNRQVSVPPNFHLISVTHLGPGARVDFNEEHFKRLGRQYVIYPNAAELLEHLRRQEAQLAARTNPSAETQERLAALRDTAQLQRYLFLFLKANDIIAKRYSVGYQLGHGSNIRRLYRSNDFPELKGIFINHLNALRPADPLEESDFDGIDYTLRRGGEQPGSSYIARQVQFLQDTGYFVEITMVAATALLTALIGWWMLRRREQLIRRYGDRAQQIFSAFEKQQISADTAARRLEEIKKEVDNLVLRRKLNYTEGLYFLAFIEDKVRRIEFARNVSENFLELFNTFMEDDVLTESEYVKLLQFLQSIRHKIPADAYEQFRDKVEKAYAREETEREKGRK